MAETLTKSKRGRLIRNLFTTPSTKRNGDAPCYVYLIKCGEFTKIGVATKPESRLAELQVGNPFAISLLKMWKLHSKENAFRVERTLHKTLSKFRALGEWFRLPPEELHYMMGAIDVWPMQPVNPFTQFDNGGLWEAVQTELKKPIPFASM